MTGIDHQDNPTIDEAARWLADQQPPPRLAVPELRQRFGLSAVESCQAIALAHEYRHGRKVAG